MESLIMMRYGHHLHRSGTDRRCVRVACARFNHQRREVDMALVVMIAAFTLFLAGLLLMSGGWFGPKRDAEHARLDAEDVQRETEEDEPRVPDWALVQDPTTPEDYTTHDDYDDEDPA